MRMVVLCFCSPDDTVRGEHLTFGEDDQKHKSVVGNEDAMLHHLVQHFAPLSGTVLDLTGWQGTCIC